MERIAQMQLLVAAKSQWPDKEGISQRCNQEQAAVYDTATEGEKNGFAFFIWKK